ncbi:hypothetical protein Dimus_016784, partial [Dionaea muscipula]
MQDSVDSEVFQEPNLGLLGSSREKWGEASDTLIETQVDLATRAGDRYIRALKSGGDSVIVDVEAGQEDGSL